jgi:hypothetical protein
MASTYSDLKIELIGTGEQAGTWGSTTNANLGIALEEAITGSADVVFSNANVTLVFTNTNTAQIARNLRLVCVGVSGGPRELILGSGCQINKLYLIQNNLADAVTIKNTTGTGVTIPAGKKQFVFNDGINVVEATSATVNLSSDVTGTLAPTNGGTGRSSFTSGSILVGNNAGPAIEVSGATPGQVLSWNGAAWEASSAPATGVVSFSGGTTGLTPSAATGGAVTLGGVLGVSNGGTGGSTTSTARSLLDVPSSSGVGATGTWNINISGSASSASNASFANTAGSCTTAQLANVLLESTQNQYTAKGWVRFDGTGIFITTSRNVSSISYNGVGNYTINWSSSVSEGQCFIGSVSNANTDGSAGILFARTYGFNSVNVFSLGLNAGFNNWRNCTGVVYF